MPAIPYGPMYLTAEPEALCGKLSKSSGGRLRKPSLRSLGFPFQGSSPEIISCVMLQPDSQFAKAYEKGVNKKDYWDPIYEDSLNLIAKLPGIAALIYRNTYFGGNKIPHDNSLDWAANLAHQMGESPPADYTTQLLNTEVCSFASSAAVSSQTLCSMQHMWKQAHETQEAP